MKDLLLILGISVVLFGCPSPSEIEQPETPQLNCTNPWILPDEYGGTCFECPEGTHWDRRTQSPVQYQRFGVYGNTVCDQGRSTWGTQRGIYCMEWPSDGVGHNGHKSVWCEPVTPKEKSR